MEDMSKYCHKDCKYDCANCKTYNDIEAAWWAGYNNAMGVNDAPGELPETAVRVELHDTNEYFYDMNTGHILSKGDII